MIGHQTVLDLDGRILFCQQHYGKMLTFCNKIIKIFIFLYRHSFRKLMEVFVVYKTNLTTIFNNIIFSFKYMLNINDKK